MSWEAMALSVQLACMVSALLFVVGMPIAYWIAFSRWRWKFLVESVVALPLVLPPTVLGFYLLVAMGPRSPLGALWLRLFGHTLSFTFGGLVVASLVYSLPFAVQPFAAAFRSVDRQLVNASATLGVSRLRTFARVVVPLSSRNHHRAGAQLCPYSGRVWSSADGRRKYSRRDPHRLHRYL